ncbi:hypothetical protein [Turicibacter sp. TJ11]|uniref:hypothetical protein n=1 Tax=Turicibacter sp. TJ11 TaxID=2806443 RepID=UPI001F4201D1|nr:hypothetical protein [Turicibacter sp. TJ11]
MINYLRILRFISIIGSLLSVSFLLFNVALIFLFKNTQTLLTQTWKLFFYCTTLTLLASVLGYLFHPKRVK